MGRPISIRFLQAFGDLDHWACRRREAFGVRPTCVQAGPSSRFTLGKTRRPCNSRTLAYFTVVPGGPREQKKTVPGNSPGVAESIFAHLPRSSWCVSVRWWAHNRNTIFGGSCRHFLREVRADIAKPTLSMPPRVLPLGPKLAH